MSSSFWEAEIDGWSVGGVRRSAGKWRPRSRSGETDYVEYVTLACSLDEVELSAGMG